MESAAKRPKLSLLLPKNRGKTRLVHPFLPTKWAGSNSFGKDVTNVRSFASQSNSLMSTVQNRSALFGSLNHCNVNINFNIPSRKSEDCLMENMPL